MEPVIELESGKRPKGSERRAALAIGTAAALVLGIGGFAAGRLSAPNDARTSAVGAEPVAPEPTLPPATDPPVPDTAAWADVASETATSDEMPTSFAPIGGGGSGQYAANAYEEAAMDLLAERTTADGITVRAHLMLNNEGDYNSDPWPGADFGGWTPATWCFPSGNLRISIVTSNATNLGWAPWYTEPKDGLSVSSFSAGYVESSPVFGLVVQAPGSTSVTFTTADGRTDTATTSGDIALLAVVGPITDDFTIDVDDPSGTSSVGARELTESWSSPDYRAGCEPPPPALPDAGEQPADPAAARAAIEESWRFARDFGDVEQGKRIGYIDDPTGIEAAWQALAEGDYGEAAESSKSTIRDLVFTSPTEAWLRYDVESTIASFPNRYGIIRLGDDGVWRVTRATVCQDIALAPGYACDPPVEVIYPPSAEKDPRFNPRFYELYGDEFALGESLATTAPAAADTTVAEAEG